MEGEGNPDILSLKEGEPDEKNTTTIDKEGLAKKDVPHIIKDKRKASEYLQNNSKLKYTCLNMIVNFQGQTLDIHCLWSFFNLTLN